MKTPANDTRLSEHFTLEEFLNTRKYPCNKPSLQHVANMVYGCVMLLEPARQVVGPIIVNSGFRNEDVNAMWVVSATRSTSQARLPTSAPRTLNSSCDSSTS